MIRAKANSAHFLIPGAIRRFVSVAALVLLPAAFLCQGACGSGDRDETDDGREASSAGRNESSVPERFNESAPLYRAAVVAEYPHDESAFTQGLAFDEGILYEGTGIRGQSTLREVDLETGTVLRIRELEDDLFGEGITVLGDRIIQLTWQANTAFVYDRTTLEPMGEFGYPSEGWGLTHDGTRLIMSDGSPTLRLIDPETYEIIGSLKVRDGMTLVRGLNELEYYKDEILANVWPTTRIAKIAPETGKVTGWIQLERSLLPDGRSAFGKVANGIAYDEDNDRLFVTGKYWPKLYEIKLVAVD
jgi:glutamine cyclotransferase